MMYAPRLPLCQWARHRLEKLAKLEPGSLRKHKAGCAVPCRVSRCIGCSSSV